MPDRVHHLHEEMGPLIREVTRALDFNLSRYDKPYLHGHKILAAAERRDTNHCILLDTETYLAQPFDNARLYQPDAVGVVPESVAGFARRFLSVWDATYAVFGLTTPTERVQMLRNGVKHRRYFNAGFAAFPEVTPSGARFGEL